jgi:hypothetical protein
MRVICGVSERVRNRESDFSRQGTVTGLERLEDLERVLRVNRIECKLK